MDKHETEQEKKDRERKEILDELNNNSNINSDVDSNIQSFGPTKKKSVVSFNKEEAKEEEKIEQPSLIVKPEQGNNKTLTILLIGLIFVVISVLAFPFIRSSITKWQLDRKPRPEQPEKKEEEKVYEEITLESEVVSKLKYPVMHNDKNTKTTYYSKDSIRISDFSNNDILYNALLDVYTGNMAKYTGKYNGKFCGSQKVSLNARYIKLRIDNLFTKKAKYQLTDFVVPATNTKTKYVGTWKYDRVKDVFVYYGNCNGVKNAAVQYYDIRVPFAASSSARNVDIYVKNYVGFAAVNPTSKAFVLYKNSAYTEEVTRGTLPSSNIESELSKLVKDNKDKFNTYTYTYSIVDCAYQDYCFVSGAWDK